MALEEFSLFPVGVWVSVHAYTCKYCWSMWLFCCCNPSRWKGSPFQIKLKFPSLFLHFSPWSKLAEGGSWFLSVYSLHDTPFSETCSELSTLKQDPAAAALATWHLIACNGTSSLEMWFLVEGGWWRWWSWSRVGGQRDGWLTHRRGGSETEEDIKFLHLNVSEPHVIGCRAWMTSERWLPLMGSLKDPECCSKQNRLSEIIHEALHTIKHKLL